MTLRGPEARGATIAELDPRCLPLWVLPSLSIAEVYLTFESITVSCMHQFDRCEDRLFTLTPPPLREHPRQPLRSVDTPGPVYLSTLDTLARC